MTITWGACGHPMRTAERGGGCRVCSLLRLTSDECHDYMDEHSASYRERCDARGTWRGREDEANAWEPCNGSCVSGYCANTDGGMTLEQRAYFEASRRETATLPCPPGSTFTDVMTLRGPGIGHMHLPILYPVVDPDTGEPFAPYLRPAHMSGRMVETIEMYGYYNTRVAARRGAGTFTGITD